MNQLIEFVPRCSRHSKSMGAGPQCFSKCREEVEAALASKPEVALPKQDHLLPKEVKLEKAKAALATAVSKTVSKTLGAVAGRRSRPATGALTNAEHQARWRKAHPEQHATQQRAARARRKGKLPGGKVTS